MLHVDLLPTGTALRQPRSPTATGSLAGPRRQRPSLRESPTRPREHCTDTDTLVPAADLITKPTATMGCRDNGDVHDRRLERRPINATGATVAGMAGVLSSGTWTCGERRLDARVR